MNERDLLQQVREWISRTPENEVRAEFAIRGVGESTTRRIINGKYNCRPGPMLRSILASIVEAKKAS